MHARWIPQLAALVWITAACPASSTTEEGGDTGAAASQTGGCDLGTAPPPGCPGGLCLAPAGTCEDDGIVCNVDRNYCYDPDDPCSGFLCGGPERGTCVEDPGVPSCVCNESYENETFELYCCPLDGSDPECTG